MMRNRSIRFKLTLWFSLVLIAAMGVTLLAVLWASRIVLRGTVRDYLISTVEENVDDIQYVISKGDVGINSYIPCSDGYLEIDLDFMDEVNEVYTALYTSDGTMLYGENPLSNLTERMTFTQSRTWHMTVEKVPYDLYDRKLNIGLPNGDVLWIRGVVSEARSLAQLRKIIRLSLILLPLLILLCILSGYVLADRLLSPIRRIEQTAEQISRGDDLKQRIDMGNSNDEVGRLARVFNRMLDRLERSFEAERRFSSDASHELRTPTAVLLAQTDYTLEKERSTQEYIEALTVIQKQGRRMHALINDMLDFTRMEQSPERYPLEPLDLSLIVSETVDQMALIVTEKVSMERQIAEGIMIQGNGMLLTRLVQNLISNACRYGRENGQILVSLSRNGTDAVLSVADNGIGIAKEEQTRIFDRFYRSDISRSVQGTGLGLSMVKRIAELHDARIEVDSEPGEGSTFRVIFPKAADSNVPLILPD